MSRVKFYRVELHVGAVWKDGACAICSVEELQNCPEEKCTADLHEGALLDTWDSYAGRSAGRQCDMHHSDWFSRVDAEGGIHRTDFAQVRAPW